MMLRLVLICGLFAVPLSAAQDPAAGDTVTISRDEFERLMDRVRSLESIVGELSGVSASLERLKVEIPEPDPYAMTVTYKDGLRFGMNNGDVNIKIAGKLHQIFTTADADSGLEDTVGSVGDGFEFRRAEIAISGELYDQMAFKMGYDFAGGDADFKDMYVALKQIPVVGTIKVGHFKEPISLEEQTSSSTITLVERSLIRALGFSRNSGVMVQNTAGEESRMQWAVGLFQSDSDSFGDSEGDGDWAVTSRMTGLPVYDMDNRRYLHLGAAVSVRSAADGMLRYRSRPEAHQVPYFADTGEFAADGSNVYAAEIAYVDGPLTLSAEANITAVDSGAANDPEFSSHYIQASYYLTGESQPYDRKKGRFSQVTPDDPYIRSKEAGPRGIGAWQVAARYSHLDLTDRGIVGGEMDDYTVGLNWYLSKNMRMKFNYVRSSLDLSGSSDGDADIILVGLFTEF